MEPLLTRIVRGVGANVVGQVLSVARNILLVPVFLRCWGSQVYGEWLVISAALSYLMLLDFGMQSYVVNRMGQAWAQGRRADLHEDLHGSLRVFLAAGVVAMAVLSTLVWVVPLQDVLNLKATSGRTAALTILVLAVNTLFNAIPMGLVGGLYRATGAYARGTMIGNLGGIVYLLVTVVVVAMRSSMLTLAFSWIAVNVGVVTLCLMDLRRLRPEISLAPTTGSLAHGLGLLGGASSFLMMSLAGALTTQAPLLVLNWFVGSIAVVQFATTRTMAYVITQFSNVVNTALWPELTALEARGQWADVRRISYALIKLNLSLAVVCALLLRFVGTDLYQMWTGRTLAFEPRLLDVLLLQVVSAAFWNTSGLPLVASNRQHAYAGLTVANSALGFLLSVALSPGWGVFGVAAALLISDTVCNAVFVPWLSSRFLGDPLPVLLRRCAMSPVLIGGGLLIILEGLQLVLASSMWRFVVVPPVVLGVYAAAGYWMLLDTGERQLLRGMPQRLRAHFG